MKNLLKYLLFGIVALAFYGSADKVQSCVEEFSAIEMQVDETSVQDFALSSNEADLSVPRQVSSVSMVRLQKGSSRKQVNNWRQGYEYLKSGKTVNPHTQLVVQRKSLICHSSLVEPACNLSRLCRFII